MVFGIPIAKLIPEVFKAVTKPMVNVLKRNVRKSPFWRDKMFIPMAQYYNRISVRVRLWTQGIRRNREQLEKSSEMSDEAALELGAEMVANFMTFVLGLMAIIMQQSIAAATEKKKEDEQHDESEAVETRISGLQNSVMEISSRIRSLEEQQQQLNQMVVLMKPIKKS